MLSNSLRGHIHSKHMTQGPEFFGSRDLSYIPYWRKNKIHLLKTSKKRLRDNYHYMRNADFPYGGQAIVLLSLSCVSQRKWDPSAQTLNLSRSWVGEWGVCSKHREWHLHRCRNERL